ncbi:MAG: hypothetical protein Q9159_007713 [Coniocarpon cinnabarinum]
MPESSKGSRFYQTVKDIVKKPGKHERGQSTSSQTEEASPEEQPGQHKHGRSASSKTEKASAEDPRKMAPEQRAPSFPQPPELTYLCEQLHELCKEKTEADRSMVAVELGRLKKAYEKASGHMVDPLRQVIPDEVWDRYREIYAPEDTQKEKDWVEQWLYWADGRHAKDNGGKCAVKGDPKNGRRDKKPPRTPEGSPRASTSSSTSSKK